MEDDEWRSLVKQSRFPWSQYKEEWVYETYEKKYNVPLSPYEMEALERARKELSAAEKEKARIAELPHYAQVYDQDLPGDLVSTKWILFVNKQDTTVYPARDIRTMVYRDGDRFFYTGYCQGRFIPKPIELTESETRDFMLIILKAEYK